MIFDIETVSLGEEKLKEVRPDLFEDQSMPEHIANPIIPPAEDMKAPASFKDPEKIKQRQQDMHAKMIQEAEDAKVQWKVNLQDKRQKFIDDAALDARFSFCKMIGIRSHLIDDVHTVIHVVESNEKIKATILNVPWPEYLEVKFHATEKEMLSFVFGVVANCIGVGKDMEKLITYYGHQFDLPYLFRRAWIVGVKPPYFLRRGRYFSDDLCCDLYELWTLGERMAKSGGLDGLCAALGLPGKEGDGKAFWKLYNENPAGAVDYCASDIEITNACAEKMGVIE